MREGLQTGRSLWSRSAANAGCGGGDEPSGTAARPGSADDHRRPAGGRHHRGGGEQPLGDILADAEGRTLYAFTKDKGDQSAYGGQCADNWPALTGTATAGTGVQASLLSAAMQANGDGQVTYSGRPLYYFAGDAKPGDTNGQGVGNVWFVLTADGSWSEGGGRRRLPPDRGGLRPAGRASQCSRSAAGMGRPRWWPRSMVERTITASLELSSIWPTKLWSTLSSSTGRS